MIDPWVDGDVAIASLVLLGQQLREETPAELPERSEPPTSSKLDDIPDPRLDLVLQEGQYTAHEAEDGVAPNVRVPREGRKHVSVGVHLRDDEMVHVEHFSELR